MSDTVLNSTVSLHVTDYVQEFGSYVLQAGWRIANHKNLKNEGVRQQQETRHKNNEYARVRSVS